MNSNTMDIEPQIKPQLSDAERIRRRRAARSKKILNSGESRINKILGVYSSFTEDYDKGNDESVKSPNNKEDTKRNLLEKENAEVNTSKVEVDIDSKKEKVLANSTTKVGIDVQPTLTIAPPIAQNNEKELGSILNTGTIISEDTLSQQELQDQLKEQIEQIKSQFLMGGTSLQENIFASDLVSNYMSNILIVLVPLISILFYFGYTFLYSDITPLDDQSRQILLGRGSAPSIDVPYIGQMMPFHIILVIEIIRQIIFYVNYKKMGNLNYKPPQSMIENVLNYYGLLGYFTKAFLLFLDDILFLVFGIGIYVILINISFPLLPL